MSKARDLADLIAAGNPLADGTVEVADISDLTATAAELNLMDGVTATTAELNYVDGVTSNVQTQLDAKQAASTAVTTSTTFGGDVSGTYDAIVIADDSHNHTISNVDNLQTTLDAKKEDLTPNVITTNTTGSADNIYYLNGATITLTLPASPSVGDVVGVSEIAGNTDNIIGRNGSNIMGVAEDMTWDVAYKAETLVYTGATVGWAFSG